MLVSRQSKMTPKKFNQALSSLVQRLQACKENFQFDSEPADKAVLEKSECVGCLILSMFTCLRSMRVSKDAGNKGNVHMLAQIHTVTSTTIRSAAQSFLCMLIQHTCIGCTMLACLVWDAQLSVGQISATVCLVRSQAKYYTRVEDMRSTST